MAAFAVLVAGSFALGARAAPHVDPTVLNAVRFVLAAGLLVGVVLATGGTARDTYKAPWRYAILAALYVLYFVTMFEGLKTAAPVSMAAVFTLNPILAALFGWLLLRQVTTPRMGLALALGAIGALWVIFRGDLALALTFQVGRGEAIYFWGCVAHALYAPLLRAFNRGEAAVAFNAGVLSMGAGLLLVWSGPRLLEVDWGALPAIVWITIVYTAIAATAVSFLLVRFAALRLPAAKVMAYTYLVPVTVIAWEVSLGGALPALQVLPGVVLILLALWMLLRDDWAPGS